MYTLIRRSVYAYDVYFYACHFYVVSVHVYNVCICVRACLSVYVCIVVGPRARKLSANAFHRLPPTPHPTPHPHTHLTRPKICADSSPPTSRPVRNFALATIEAFRP